MNAGLGEHITAMVTGGARGHHRGSDKGRLELTWTDKDKALLSTGDGRYDYTLA